MMRSTEMPRLLGDQAFRFISHFAYARMSIIGTVAQV